MKVIKYLRLSAGLLSLVINQTAISQTSRTEAAPFNFKGKLLIAVSDADMVGSAYADGKLGTNIGHDVLSVIRLDKRPAEMRATTIEVSNSVTGPPLSVEVTPDRKYAIVIETRGAPPEK